MADPRTRRVGVAAYGLAWSLLLVAATLGALWAEPSAPAKQRTAQPPSQPASPPASPPQPAPVSQPSKAPSPEPAQPQSPAPPALLAQYGPAQPPSLPTPAPAPPPSESPPAPAPAQPTVPPAPPPVPPPTLTPPSPFVPQPGVPPQTLPQQKVAEIVVRGNDKIPTEQILAVVSTKVTDPLNEDKIRNDVQAILNLGVFADAVVRFEPLPEGLRVVFLVVENPVVQQITVTGNTVVSTPEVLKALGVQTGAVLNTVTMRAGVRAVERLYQDQGYVLTHVSDVNVSPEGVLTVQLAEGRIEAIKIDGLKKTHEFVVRRELLFHVGDVFNVNAVNASLKRLFQLQYFSDVKAQPGPGSAPDTVDVTILVTEQRTASVNFGLGYGNQTGLEGFIGLRETNLFGNGQTISIQFSNTVLFGSAYVLAFREPYFLGSRTILDLTLFDQTTIPTEYVSLGINNSFQYNLFQLGALLRFTSPLSAIDSVSYGLKIENSTFSSPPFVGTAPPAGFNFAGPNGFTTPGQTDAVILTVNRDTRNDPQLPIRGDHITLGGEFAFQALGGSFQFQKYDLDYAHFFPLSPESTIVAHIHLGYSPVFLPLQEQFYLGGQNSLRGFPTGRFRGDELVLGQLEYRFPLSALPLAHALTGVTLVLFIEAGDAEVQGAAPINLQPDVGLGFQVKTPVGPFRIDYAISGEGQQFWVSTGAIF